MVSRAVIIFVVLAIARCSSAFFSQSAVPVSASMTIALTAEMFSGAATAVTEIPAAAAKAASTAVILLNCRFISAPL